MKKWTLVYISVICSFTWCRGQSGGGSSPNPDDNKVICIVPGIDSIIYYYGNSPQMDEAKRGRISDTAFINGMFQAVKDRGSLLVIKPGAGVRVLPDLKEMVLLSNDHKVAHRSLDTLNADEGKTFGYATPSTIKAVIESERLVILLVGDNEIYAYPTGDIHKGKKYTYAECRDMLMIKKENKTFSVMIRPAANSTYRNTVNMLDEMKKVGIARYALIDITKEEEDYLRQIYR
ncbi:MAG TPA: hypothetical protein VHC48_21805 [Puia sp.]|nr:hypothetical protein [Puia sp.]